MKQPSTHYFDFIIIGGGIAGTSIGYELSKSKQVLLVEQEDAFGYHTTGRSAATYIELLHNQTIVALSRASKSFLNTPPPGFTQSPLLQPCACIVTAKASEKKALDEAFQLAIGLGTDVIQISADSVIAQIPIMRKTSMKLAAGLIEPQAQRIDVDALLQGYIKGIRAHGGQLRSRVNIDHISRSGGIWKLRLATQHETLETPVIINAAGAWVDQVAIMAGVKPIGFTPKRRTMITFDAPPSHDISGWPMIADLSGSFYFIPESGQLMGSPADETPSPPCDAQADELDIATAIYNIEQHTYLQIKKINHKWAGLRTFAPDHLPVLGFEPTTEGFFWVAGQGGFGIQTAPAMARLGAALALNQQPVELGDTMHVDLRQVLPDRFR